jgi:hypothetical protein
LDASIANLFWNARRNVLIRPVNHLKALFKFQEKRKFENPSDRPQLERKGADTREAPGIPEGFNSRKNKTVVNLQFIKMSDPLWTWPGPS